MRLLHPMQLNNKTMTKLMRGKILSIESPKDNFTKVPNELLVARDLTAVEKLILIRLYYYPKQWTLAYSRMAKELGLDKSNVIKCWKNLVIKGWIVEDQDCYYISQPKTMRCLKPPLEVGSSNNIGSNTQPTQVVLNHQDGCATPAIEEDTDRIRLRNKTKEEPKSTTNANSLNDDKQVIPSKREKVIELLNNYCYDELSNYLSKELIQRILNENSINIDVKLKFIYSFIFTNHEFTYSNKQFITDDSTDFNAIDSKFKDCQSVESSGSPIVIPTIKDSTTNKVIETLDKGDKVSVISNTEGEVVTNINSFDEFISRFNKEQLLEFKGMAFNKFIKATNYLFHESKYDLQCSIYHRLLKFNKYEFSSPKKEPAMTASQNLNGSADVYKLMDEVEGVGKYS